MILKCSFKLTCYVGDIPLIKGGARKIQRRESPSETITSAVLAYVSGMSSSDGKQHGVQAASKPCLQSGVPPMSKVRLSSEYIEVTAHTISSAAR